MASVVRMGIAAGVGLAGTTVHDRSICRSPVQRHGAVGASRVADSGVAARAMAQ